MTGSESCYSFAIVAVPWVKDVRWIKSFDLYIKPGRNDSSAAVSKGTRLNGVYWGAVYVLTIQQYRWTYCGTASHLELMTSGA
jgi:hypothetical protein